ncbi:MAG: Gfo/Idh/MocA family oxidoreductase [Clostridiales bacterium]|nr:Gfo/Idh/MocA family oxidoreductase [Clostridiales bacterium]
MKILLIGSGNRAKAYAMYLKDDIACVCDINVSKAELLIKEYNLKNAVVCENYKEAGTFDGIVIAVPDYVHEEVFLWAVKQDVPLLLEKPVSVTNDSLKLMLEAGKNFKKGIILGFTLRYTPMYLKIIGLLRNKAIGELISVEAAELVGPVHAAKFFRRWHRFSKNSGGFLNTKCSHDMDIINQILPGRPRYIASFGRNSIFKPGRGRDVCNNECPEYEECRFVDNSEHKFSTADTSLCPFNVESDIVDHQVISMEFDNGATAVFTVSMHCDKGDRHVYIHGTSGSIKSSFSDQIVYLCKTGKPDELFEPDNTKGSHGGGDRILCEQFKDCIQSGEGENQLQDGATASAMAFAADLSRTSGKVIDMDIFADYIYIKK